MIFWRPCSYKFFQPSIHPFIHPLNIYQCPHYCEMPLLRRKSSNWEFIASCWRETCQRSSSLAYFIYTTRIMMNIKLFCTRLRIQSTLNKWQYRYSTAPQLGLDSVLWRYIPGKWVWGWPHRFVNTQEYIEAVCCLLGDWGEYKTLQIQSQYVFKMIVEPIASQNSDMAWNKRSVL